MIGRVEEEDAAKPNAALRRKLFIMPIRHILLIIFFSLCNKIVFNDLH